MYVNMSSDYGDFRESEESGAVTLNGSVINLGAVNLKESGIDDVESEFNWQIVTKMSQEVVKGRILPDEKASEEDTQLGNGTKKLGEYWSRDYPCIRCEECSPALPNFRRNMRLPSSGLKNEKLAKI
jgi:hypothetical protein